MCNEYLEIRWKLLSFASLISPFKIIKGNIKQSTQCFVTRWNISKIVMNTPLRFFFFNTLLTVSSGAIKHETQCFITGRDFARKTKSRGGTLIARAYIKESTYSWNMPSVCNKKSLFAWTEAALNRWVMMTFLLFAPASKRWLGWRKDRKYRRDLLLGIFCDIYYTVILQSLLRYVSSVTFCGEAVLKVMDQRH